MPENDFSKKVRALRAKHGLTLEQVANQVGVGSSTVRKWETGMIENIRRDKISKLALALHTTPAYLMGWDEIPTDKLQPLPPMKQWQIIGSTACGAPLYRALDETVSAPASVDADFVFKCVGDSMIGARILDGDLVFVKRCAVENGQIGVVRIGEEYTLKRIYHGSDYLELRAENPMYPPIIVRGEQENAEIVGRAVHYLSRVI